MNKLPRLWIRRCKFYALTLFCAATLFACNAQVAPSAVQTQAEQVRSADAFVDSMGINVHLIYDDNVYVQKYNSIIKPRLQELGIRHIRDGSEINKPDYYARLKDLEKIGIRATLIEGIGRVTPEQAVAIANEVGNAQEAVEAPNEFDVGKESKQWVPWVRDYLKQLHDAFKKYPATSKLPFIGPSFVGGDSSTQVGDLRQWVDYGNMHPYNYPNHPGDGNIDREIANRSKPTQGKPIIATEAGYYTGGPKTDRPVSEKAQGKYLPRLFLEYFNRNVFRTFSYELIDQRPNPDDSEANFGILRNDGSPKPAFIALKNLITLLKDPGSSFPLKSLDYTLSGNTNNVHRTLLQKRDGTFYLILWQEVSSYDPRKREDLSVPEQSVTLNLNTPISQASVYQPLNSIAAISQYKTPKQIELKVPDHPLVIQLVTASSQSSSFQMSVGQRSPTS